jgi:3-phosphoshikimate 1-carboxyvinyltransferase
VCRATLRCIQALGVKAEEREDEHAMTELLIRGVGLRGLREPVDVLHCAGSGTTIRLMAGLLAGQPFTSVLTGTEPLRRRPMGRVAEPLREMGATILGRDGGRLAPLTIRGGDLRGIRYDMPIASAQVKSAILLAGLFAVGETTVIEPGPSRDHTERMLRAFGVEVRSDDGEVTLAGGRRLHPPPGGRVIIPGDFSSAAFPLVAAAIVPGSDITLTGVGLNPTRTGLHDLLVAAGADIAVSTGAPPEGDAPAGDSPENPNAPGAEAALAGCLRAPERPAKASTPFGPSGEPLGELHARWSPLRPTEAAGDLIVRSIDEFPIFAVAATQAGGATVVREAAELRVKESDRIATVAGELRKMGARVDEQPDGMVIRGPARLRGAVVECHRDHRLAMSLAVAGLVAEGETIVRGAEAIDDSFPGFVEAMQALGADIRWR